MQQRRENSALQHGHERRTMRRFDMRLPATVRVAGQSFRDLSTETQNVSARGVFFYLDRPLAEGMGIEVTMTFPPHVTLTEPVRVRFTARVVRIETSQAAAGVGVAAMIEEYEFLRSNSAAEFSSDGRFGT
ncbi:MAG: PilZ domain-containing protein [Terriglobales bacterium]|nr:PilZ domain-containing protein [Terriglobales bacterium]